MKMKLIIACVAVTGLTFASIDYAAAKNHQHFDDRNISDLSKMDKERLEDMLDAHRLQMRPVQNELKVKKMEFRALSNNNNVQPSEIRKLSQDIVSLENKLQDDRLAFKDKVEEEFDISLGRMGHKNGKGMHDRGKKYHNQGKRYNDRHHESRNL